MFSQNSIYPDSSASSLVLKTPIGTGLSGNSPNISANDGSLALDDANKKLYLGASNLWVPVGDVVGPASSTDNAVARFDGTTGKAIQNSVVIISDAGDITGVNTINGQAPLVTLAAVGSTPNANGATLTGQALNLEPADLTNPGVVTTVLQRLTGVKIFSSGIMVRNTASSISQIQSLFNTYYELQLLSGGANPVVIAGACNIGSTDVMISRIGKTVFFNIKFYNGGNTTGGAGPITLTFPTAMNSTNPGNLPLEFIPQTDVYGTAQVINSGATITGLYKVTSAGAMSFGTGWAASSINVMSNFDANATNGLNACTLTWTVA